MEIFRFILITFLTGAFSYTAVSQSPPAHPIAALESAVRNLTVDDYYRFKELSDARISPDAKWVAYVVKTPKADEDKIEERIWMAPSEGGEAIALTAGGEVSNHPRWSPDGKFLAFISQREEGKKQVWLLNLLGGEAQPLTGTIQDVSDFAWAPASDRLVLALQDPSPDELGRRRTRRKPKSRRKENPSPSPGPS